MKELPELENAILRIKAKYLRQVEKALNDPVPELWGEGFAEYRLSGVHDALTACRKEINLIKAKIEAKNAQSLRDTERHLLLRKQNEANKI